MFNPNSVFQRCRNSRCKAWLKDPVENPRNAFCCSGCEAGFYRRHCRVCERPFEAKNSRKQLCGRDSCEHEFRRNKPRLFSDWHPSATLAVKPEKSSTKSTAKTTIKSDRAWVHIAGPSLSEVGLRLTDYDLEVLRDNFRVNAKHWNAAALIGPNDPPVNILGGYKFPGAPNVNLKPDHDPFAGAVQSRWSPVATTIGDDLWIPGFLRRTP